MSSDLSEREVLELATSVGVGDVSRARLESMLELILVEGVSCQLYTRALLNRPEPPGSAATDEPVAACTVAIEQGLGALSDEDLLRLAQSPVLLLIAHERILTRPTAPWFEVFERFIAAEPLASTPDVSSAWEARIASFLEDKDLPAPLREAAKECLANPKSLEGADSKRLHMLHFGWLETLTPDKIQGALREALVDAVRGLAGKSDLLTSSQEAPLDQGGSYYGVELGNFPAESVQAFAQYPFYLTQSRRARGWSLIPYGLHTRLRVLVPPKHPGYDPLKAILSQGEQEPTKTAWFRDLLATAASDERYRLCCFRGSLFDDLREEFRALVAKQAGARNLELGAGRVLDSLPAPGRGATWTPVPDFESGFRHVTNPFVFDVGDRTPIDRRWLDTHQVVELAHGLDIPAGIGVSAPLALYLVEHRRWRKLLDALRPTLLACRAELESLGVRLDARLLAAKPQASAAPPLPHTALVVET